MNITMSTFYCAVHSAASVEWKEYFLEAHFGLNHFTIRCVFSELMPTAAIIFFDSYIISHLLRTRRRLPQGYRERSRTTSWMNIVLILHSLLFLCSLFSHIAGHFSVVEAHEARWILLSVLINSSLNFYLYCLSGRAFRHEIRAFLQRLKPRCFCKCQIHHPRQQQCSQNQTLYKD